ncbi:MAG: hypothetical protein JEY97_15620 [Bacteroidales bacterium]|nr:hypothetical protein [Bacteroidales bacterium]
MSIISSSVSEISLGAVHWYRSSFSSGELFQANDQMNFNACQILLLTIGEESKKIEAFLKFQLSSTPWELIAGLRNRLTND